MKRDVYVHPSIDALDTRLRDALERLAPVRFESCNDLARCRPGDPVLSLSGEADMLNALSAAGVDYYHATTTRVPLRSDAETAGVRFSDSARLERLLRGRRLPQRKLEHFVPVAVQLGDEVLADYAGQPLWTARPSAQGVGDIVSTCPPRFADGEQALDYLNGYDFILLLPLLHFLRRVSASFAWTQPKLRACFTFDDPNLHWPTYGCLSYREIARRAARDRFHVAIATVPLDAWGMHPGAVALFKEHPAQLSLVIHGNNHTREEYGQIRDPDAQLALVSQSLTRIQRLERATGLRIDRAIVPPHEALNEAATGAMLALGLEGASLAAWSLRHWSQTDLSASFGADPADMTRSGFPCLDRYRLTDDCEAPAVISAFLGKPMIFVEHHEALANGHEMLSAAATVVNALGDVEWQGLQSLLRANVFQRRDGAVLRVRPYCARFEVSVPDGVDRLEFDSGNDISGSCYLPVRSSGVAAEDGRVFNVAPGETLEFADARLGAVTCNDASAAFSIGAFSRRMACEARDRWVGYRAKRRSRAAAP